ncbi:molybdopterin-synthase adenylyltransferase MoeB [Ascidiimonas aurantiaca]|uniref:molybdopterin-synthase adenylyltransferase MoeB n=1 Tax=Ascidiimonas aurantiaca TaxID=1685432 RepID=UPI0030EE6CAB
MLVEVNDYLNRLRETVEEVSVSEAFEKQKKGKYLIDIREKDEVSSGSPIDAVRIPKGTLEMQLGQFITDSESELYLICASGRRSLIAAFSLKEMGYENVYSVKGGFNEWKNKTLPFETPKTLTPEDQERYKRHLLIPEVGESGQLKLLESKALIVGAGGIGSPVAWYLAAAGVGTIGIIDNDVVDATNLQRQILHTEKSVGSSKVASAKERLQSLNSGIEIITYDERLTADNVETVLSGYDVVLDGTDNFTTRYLINDACVKMGIPNVHGSVFRFEGQVSTFWPAKEKGKAPCYRCVYPTPPPSELAPSCAEAGVLGVLPGMVGLMCATEAIKILAGFGELLVGKLLVYNAINWDFDVFEVNHREDCAYCGCKDPSGYPDYASYTETCEAP